MWMYHLTITPPKLFAGLQPLYWNLLSQSSVSDFEYSISNLVHFTLMIMHKITLSYGTSARKYSKDRIESPKLNELVTN